MVTFYMLMMHGSRSLCLQHHFNNLHIQHAVHARMSLDTLHAAANAGPAREAGLNLARQLHSHASAHMLRKCQCMKDTAISMLLSWAVHSCHHLQHDQSAYIMHHAAKHQHCRPESDR